MSRNPLVVDRNPRHSRRRRAVVVPVDRRAPGSRPFDPIRRAASDTVDERVYEPLELRQMLAAHVAGSTVNYATIQAAVDAAAAGGTVTVDAGTYNETVSVYKPLTLRGAQSSNDARNARGAETHVFASKTVFDVFANDVTIDGFVIEGNRADIGAQLGAGVLMRPNIHGTRVLNNVVQNNVTGIYLSNDSNTDQCLIQHNLIQNNFEANNSWTKVPGENGSRGIYTDGTVSGGYLTNVLIDANRLYNSDYNGGDEDMGMISLQALSAGKQFNVAITNNFIGNESKALLATNVTNLTFMGNTVTQLNDGASGPVRFEGNSNTVNIQYNSIYGNAGPAVAVDSAGVPGDSSGFVVNNNNLYQNGSNIGVIVMASVYNGPLVAVGDWWGSANGPGGLGPGTGQQVWGNGNTGHGVTPRGLAGGGPVTFSPWATAKIDITRIPAPAAPGGLAAAALSSTSVQLSWTPPMSTATRQVLQRSTDGVTFTTVATLPPLLNNFADTGLAAGTAYTYRVAAANDTGSSAYSPAATGSTLSATGGTVALSALAWTSATSGYSTVQRNLSIVGNALKLAGTTYATGLGTHAASTITYALNGAYAMFNSVVGIDQEVNAKGTGYVDFKVVGDGVTLYDSGVISNGVVRQVAVSVAGVRSLQLVASPGIAGNIDYDHADWANATLSTPTVPTAPAAPSNLTARLSGTSASLAWTPAGTNQTAFTVQRSTDGTNFATLTATLAATATGYTDPAALTPGTTYTYRVLATNGIGTSPASNTAAVTPVVSGSVTTYLSDLTATSATTGYGAVMKDATVAGKPITLNGVAYAKGIGVHAVSQLVYSLAGQYTSFAADVGVDDEVTGKGAGNVIFRVIGDGVTLFDSGVVRNGTAPTRLLVSVTGVQTLTLVATNGVAGTIDFDHADWAGAALTGTPVVPAAPTNLVATAQTSATVKLTWTRPAGTVTSYAVDRSTDNVTFTTVTTAVAGSATAWTDPASLSAGTRYYYRIRAANAAGASANSAVAFATTLAQQTVTYLSDLTPTSATSGYGTVQKDKSVAGNAITLAGTTYAKGLGTHASSTITYALTGAFTTFTSTVGIDDEENGKGLGTVRFQVFGDGVLLFDSGVLTNNQPASVVVGIAGVRTLTLVANDGGDGIDYDHADWAGAQLLA